MLDWYDLENRADTVSEELAMAEVTARRPAAPASTNTHDGPTPG